ncbi:MAG: twin-arginine translocase TatA/TatE family subunit [Hyphomicrobiaceae bacterium]
MGTFSIWHWLIVLAIVVLLFGRGRIPELMGDVAKGIKNFKKGMTDEDKTAAQEPKAIDSTAEKSVETSSSETTKAS